MRLLCKFAVLGMLLSLSSPSFAQNAPGVTATSIKIGNTVPYSGPASSLGNVGKIIGAYLAMINERGGVNGRTIDFVSLDDGFSPPKTMEAAKRLVEGDGVAFMYATMGTAPSSAIAKYLNTNRVPQLFLISSAAKWADPAALPWSIALPWAPNYITEAGIDIRYARAKNPRARFAILYQNDDAGKEYLRGAREALGDGADRAIAAATSFEVADPTIDSQVVSLAATNADVFLIYSVTPRACAQAIRKAWELNWRPLRFISSGCANVDAILKPAGLEASKDILTLAALKPVDTAATNDKGMSEYVNFMKTRVPSIDPNYSSGVYAYYVAQALLVVLERCGNELSRENIMKQATSLKDVSLSVMLPGIALNTNAGDYAPLKDGYMLSFDGQKFVVIGELLKGQQERIR